MSKLYLFSSGRAMQNFMQKHSQGFLPQCLVLGEFFSEIMIVREKVKIPPFLKKVFLIEVLKNYNFTQKDLQLLFFERNFLGFLETSPFLLQFFNELNQYQLHISDIPQKDIYGDYEDHLRVLEEIQREYEAKLEEHHFYDFAKDYEILEEYFANFEGIEVYLDGFLSPYERELFTKISSLIPIVFHLNIDVYNQKHFEFLNSKLEANYRYSLAFPSGEILEKTEHLLHHLPTAYSCDLRIEQCAFVLQKIQEWLESGIEAERIAVILPQDDFKEFLLATDRVRNLNFAMGFEFEELKQEIQSIAHKSGAGLDFFISEVKQCQIPQSLGVQIDEILFAYKKIENLVGGLSVEQMVHLLLGEIEKMTLDDTGGGKVRVVGVLETRGLQIDRAIIVDFNQENVPKISQSDMFLNSAIRKLVGIPTLQDRQDLQKHYYLEIFKNTQVVELLCLEGHLAPFAKELGIKKTLPTPFTLFPKAEEYVYQEDEPNLALSENFKFSASNVKMFKECKRKFYWHYLKKLRAQDEEGSVALSVGAILHHCLYLAFSNHPQNAKEAFERLIFDEMEKSENELLKMELGLNLRYMQHFFKLPRPTQILELEQEFEFKLEGIRLGGRVDRIDEIDGYIRVLDYKLGKSNTIEPIQSAFYGLYAQNKYPHLPIKVGFYFVQGRSLCLDKKLEEHIIELKETLGIMQSEREFAKSSSRSICRECLYKNLCNR